MEKDYTAFIASMMAEQGPLTPQKTGEVPDLKKKGPVKAVLFDIYGTLLISSSGDVDKAGFSFSSLKRAFIDGGYIVKNQDDAVWHRMTNEYKANLQHQLNNAKSTNRPYPEIDIRKVWQLVATFGEKAGFIEMTESTDPDKAIIAYEILSNRVYPMPGMMEILDFFRSTGLPLGIVSNAQFYTIHLMNYFLGNKANATRIDGFDPDLCVFSFREGIGKPDSFLYHKLAKQLMEKYSIKAQDAIFIGNDMEKDVAAASRAGFQTVLFAGDQRSLRLRKDTVKNLQPDFIITELTQLQNLV
jgi:putative hydrolase of the HAD superfamily